MCADYVACSNCFTDHGLSLGAEQLGLTDPSICNNCGSATGKKLSLSNLEELAHRFFVWGSIQRARYGSAPAIQFNTRQKTSINSSQWLKDDIALFEKILGVGFFYYGPRRWMIGEVEPLKHLQRARSRDSITERIITEYPTKTINHNHLLYRIRKTPKPPHEPDQYDSPPAEIAGAYRLNTRNFPILYASPDLQTCIHECRISVEDDIFVATLEPIHELKLLDLTYLLKEERVTEFESLDMAIHMLFLAGKHSYYISRDIARKANSAGFDGIIYPSYFSLLRAGTMPLQTVYGISHRRIPQFQTNEQNTSVPNLAIFGRPIAEGKINVKCINKVILNRVIYDFHFGPVYF